MPIISIRSLPQPESVDRRRVMWQLCQDVAATLGIDAHHVWATWDLTPPGLYVEGGDAVGESPAVQPSATHPPIVRVTAFEGREPATIESVLVRVAQTLTDALPIEEGNIFAAWDEVTSGRVYTGGQVLHGKDYKRDPG